MIFLKLRKLNSLFYLGSGNHPSIALSGMSDTSLELLYFYSELQL